MFIRKKKYPSGNTGIIICEKRNGKLCELHRGGIAKSDEKIANLVEVGREWITKELQRRHPRLDLFGEEHEACKNELAVTESVPSNISNILING